MEPMISIPVDKTLVAFAMARIEKQMGVGVATGNLLKKVYFRGA